MGTLTKSLLCGKLWTDGDEWDQAWNKVELRDPTTIHKESKTESAQWNLHMELTHPEGSNGKATFQAPSTWLIVVDDA